MWVSDGSQWDYVMTAYMTTLWYSVPLKWQVNHEHFWYLKAFETLCEYLAFWRSSRSRQSRAHPGQNYDRGKGRGSLGGACWFPSTFMYRTPLNSHNCDLRILISIFRSAKRGEANIRMTILATSTESHVLPLLWPQCFRKMARLKEKNKNQHLSHIQNKILRLLF